MAWVFALLAVSSAAMFLAGFLPIHDAIGWEGIHRFFSSGLRNWQIPFWNKFSQGGTPFYPYYQSLGLIEPLNLAVALALKVLGVPIGYSYAATYLLLVLFITFTSYLVLEHVLRDKRLSVSFAMLQLIALLPVYIRQNGIVTAFLYMPSLTLIWLLFLETASGPGKAALLVLGGAVLGFASNIYLPSYVAFYLAALAAASLLFNAGQRKDFFRFLRSAPGLAAVAAAAVILLCLAAPMLALFRDIKYDSELLPMLRIFQKNGSTLADIYGSDLAGDFFSLGRTVSTTLFTLLGVVLEPLKLVPSVTVYYSEIVLYIGCIPLMCALYAARVSKRPYVKVFFWSAVLLLLVSCNGGYLVVANEGVLHKLISFLFPPLRTVDVFQNFGAAAIFCLIICAAAGFKEALENNDFSPFAAGLNLLVVKSFAGLFPLAVLTDRIGMFIGRFGAAAALAALAAGLLASYLIFGGLIAAVNRTYFGTKPVYHPLYLIKYTVSIFLILAFTGNVLAVPPGHFAPVNFLLAGALLSLAYLEFRSFKLKAGPASLPLLPENRRLVILAVSLTTMTDLALVNYVALHDMGYFSTLTGVLVENICCALLLVSASASFCAIVLGDKKIFLPLFERSFTRAGFAGAGEKKKSAVSGGILVVSVILLAVLVAGARNGTRRSYSFLGGRYFNWLSDNGLIREVPEKYAPYRVPFEKDYPQGFPSFWGLETYRKEKTLYTHVVVKELAGEKVCGGNRYRVRYSSAAAVSGEMSFVWELYKNDIPVPVSKPMSDKDYRCFQALFPDYLASLRMPLWESFYMTRYYYDFIVKVDLPRQVYAGGIVNPIVDFFPVSGTIIAADKYEAASIINKLPDTSAGTVLVLEKDEKAGRSDAGFGDFFDKNRRHQFKPEEIERYLYNLQLPRKPAPDFIHIVQDTGDRVVFQIDAPQEGFLYYSDGYSKYWRAELDGKPVGIHKANIAFKAVRVPAGSHTVEFRYSYGLMRAGLCLFAAAISALFLMAVWLYFRSGFGSGLPAP